jgi:hypothetical protein
MILTDLASISGKPGLYRVIARHKNGVVVESLEERKRKFPVRSNLQVAMLDKVTIFSKGTDDLFLGTIFDTIYQRYGRSLPVTPKSTARELREFMEEVAPEHDENRVYVSDVKKLVKWYNILIERLSEEALDTPFDPEASEEAASSEEEGANTSSSTEESESENNASGSETPSDDANRPDDDGTTPPDNEAGGISTTSSTSGSTSDSDPSQ